MGLFDKWKNYKSGQQTKRIARNMKSIKNAKAIKEDRMGSIEYFCEFPDINVAVPSLLTRFEYSLEHGINDTREKERCLEGIVKFKVEALPIIQSHIQTTNRIAWPIKALNKLGNEEQVVEVLKSCLDFGDISFDQAKLDKNYDILCYLVDFQLGEYTEKVSKFLEDHDERIRFAAAELLIEQNDPKIPEYLEKFLADTSAENTRIRQTVTEAFARNKWKISKPDQIEASSLGQGFKLNNQGLVEQV